MPAMTFSDGGVYKVVVNSTFLSTTLIQNAFHMKLETGGTLDQAAGVADLQDWVTDVFTVLEPFLHSNTSVVSTSIYALEGDAQTGTIALPAPIVGDVTGVPATPRQVAMLTYMPLGESRRQLRKYWGVFPESILGATGFWGTTQVNTINAGLAPLFLTTFEGTNGAWRFGHYTTGVPTSFITPASVITTTNPVVQRRRRSGRGS